MLDRADLKERLRPHMREAGSDPKLFAGLAFTVAMEHFKTTDYDFETAAETWNDVVVELLQELKLVPTTNN